jgi:hypothetical protein
VAGGLHVGCVGVVAHQLEGEVGLDRAGEVGRAAGVHVPAAVLLLERAEVVGDRGELGVVVVLEDELEEDELGLEDAVALELADPVAFGLLLGNEGGFRPFKRVLNAHPRGGGRCMGVSVCVGRDVDGEG